MESNEMEILNPGIREVMIGIRKLRPITIYPLSVIDQMKVTDMFQEALGAFLANKQSEDLQFVALFVAIIKTNLEKILNLIIDPEENAYKLLEDMDNNQLNDIAHVVYEVNYEVISKNVSGLLKKLQKKESPSVRPLQSSVESMDTDSKIFLRNLGETEE